MSLEDPPSRLFLYAPALRKTNIEKKWLITDNGMMTSHTLLYGEEPFLIQHHLQQLKEKEAIEQWTTLSENASWEEIELALQSVDMFSPMRWVLLKNPSFFKKKPSDKETQALLSLFDQLSRMQNKCVIVHYGTLDKRLTLVKKALASFTVHEFKAFQDWETDKIQQWAMGYARLKKIAIAPQALSYLVSLHGVNIQLIAQELEKLSIYKVTEDPITLTEVTKVCSSGQATLYDFNEAFKKKEGRLCMALLYKLIQQGEDPVKILGYLANGIRLYLQIKLLEQEKASYQEIGKQTGKNPYFIQMVSQAIRSAYTLPILRQSMAYLAECDYLIKSGKQNPKAAIHLTTVKILSLK